jgi:predicted transcriptional regulator
MEIAMNDEAVFAESLAFFKALADANRLKIIGLLARQPLTVEQISAILDLRPSTVSHHLSRLAKTGLVTARAESHYHVYALETERLEAKARHLLARETLPAVAVNMDLDAYDRKVVRDFSTPDGRIKAIPAQFKKMKAILRHVVRAFEPEVRYSEREVNEILRRFHDDTARLRRELVDNGLMAREGGGGAYWRADGQSRKRTTSEN